MENNIQIFENAEFGKVRTVVINDEPWFVGKDVALALGYSNTKDALAKHVDEEDKLGSQIATSGQRRQMTVINESGLYSLVLSSKLPTAKKFKRWVTSEVLPSIRKTGSYNLPNIMEKKIEVVNNNGQLVVSSRQVAENFGKRHDNVLRDIVAFQKDVLNFEEMFYETTSPDAYGRAQKTYLMNRDGFSLLAMGFTGSKALEWKLKYIQAFNDMEKTIKEHRESYMIEDPVERALKWVEEQKEKQKALKALEDQKVLESYRVSFS